MLEELMEKKMFCLEQIEYMTRALERYKIDLEEVEEQIKAQTDAS